MRAASGVDLSNLGFTLNGGEPVDCEGDQRFADEMARFGFDPDALAPSYGLAESTCAVTIPVPDGLRVDDVTVTTDAGESVRQYAVLGHPIPGMEVRLNPADARPVTGRDVGEIEIRGTSMMTGYLGQAPIDPKGGCPQGISATSPTTGWWSAAAPRSSSRWRAATCSPPRSNASRARSTASATARRGDRNG